MRFILCLLALATPALAADAGFKDIFNGRDLAGWQGLPDFWSVRDGVITGQTTVEHPLKSNTFLVYQGGEPANFELRAQFKLTVQNDKNFANSGIQYRSKIVDAAGFVVAGYQADMDSTGKYTGMLYEEKGRGILMAPGEKIRIGETTMAVDAKKKGATKKKTAVEKLPGATPAADILAALKLGDWNEIRIVAQGNHVQHWINGLLTADVTDDDPALAPKSGVLALQLHQGPPMTVEFKNLRLKTLP